jgi:hypothetical protein
MSLNLSLGDKATVLKNRCVIHIGHVISKSQTTVKVDNGMKFNVRDGSEWGSASQRWIFSSFSLIPFEDWHTEELANLKIRENFSSWARRIANAAESMQALAIDPLAKRFVLEHKDELHAIFKAMKLLEDKRLAAAEKLK